MVSILMDVKLIQSSREVFTKFLTYLTAFYKDKKGNITKRRQEEDDSVMGPRRP